MTMTPEEKLAMARECAAAICDEDKCSPLVVAGFADSQFDDHPAVRCALLAIDRMQERVRAETERCARIAEKRREARFEENGTREPDTNATYYEGHMAEIYEELDEEDEAISSAIRETPHAEG